MNEKHKRPGAGVRLRNYFLTGLIIVAPVFITAYLTWTFIGWVDGWVKPYIPAPYNPDYYLPFAVPGFGLLTALVLITLIGFLTANLVGRSIVAFGESLLDRMPLVRSLYKGLKQIFQTVLAEQSSSFKQAGLIQYPRQGLWSIVFVATETKGEVDHRLPGHDSVSVFLPTTPNPTSGFLLFVPRKDIIILDMSVEEAAKMVISAGLVSPDFPRKLPVQGKAKVKPLAP
ncbi:MAG: DUF502 domain-containing protein [Hoeflea sp.]|uniref:DUF502 domain-containing protein n=1 Tax=Hoeflea sp. TaxID=1940281 RepID=UPI002730B59C|nr:DUF502 domain-containing protein [Hoeflea sp.]MDP2118470.1 DUF502 domain-containing protein [Hoeflea sp.]MDZ7601335.1 DUF502 domain-containing protein [Hoeflea sp.]